MGRYDNARRRRRLRKLHARDACCHWCRGETVIVEQDGGMFPKNAATIDHLDDRFSPDRGRWKGRKERTVLACWGCNNDRSQRSMIEHAAEQRRRSAMGHMMKELRRAAAQMGQSPASSSGTGSMTQAASSASRAAS